ncbi:MAG: hypothetical protein JNK05_32560 [Myxococcales bacterium]|nr:hypothetical protein [Myxococcales bacterium]
MTSPTRAPTRLDHALRFVTALAMGGAAAARGCGLGASSRPTCVCSQSEPGAGGAYRTCTNAELDAGCQTRYEVEPVGPLPPPELDA